MLSTLNRIRTDLVNIEKINKDAIFQRKIPISVIYETLPPSIQPLHLEILQAKHEVDLFKIVSNSEVMKFVGDQQPWNLEKLRQLIKYSNEDAKIVGNNLRKYFYFVILLNDKIIGLIGLHVQNYDKSPNFRNKLFLTRILSSEFQGKGFGTQAIRLAVAEVKQMKPLLFSVFSDTLPENVAASKSLEKAEFFFIGNFKIRNTNYRRYELEIDDNLFPLFSESVGFLQTSGASQIPPSLRSSESAVLPTFSISPQIFSNMQPNKSYTPEQFISAVSTRQFPFPYKRFFYDDLAISTMFNNLKLYNGIARLRESPYTLKNLKVEPKFEGRYIILLNEESDYLNFNILSDMFLEDLRMRCKLKFSPISPFDYFYENYNEVSKIKPLTPYEIGEGNSLLSNEVRKSKLLSLNESKGVNILTPYEVRESLYQQVKECTSFRPANLIAIAQIFGSKSVLDFSSGWGDRLLGALALGIEYVGVDPNPKLHPRYQKMIQQFAVDPSKYITLVGTAQTAVFPTRNYDLVFTSPPYFDLEEYSGPNQSVSEVENNRTSEVVWFNNFLKIALDRSWTVLISGGYMVININQYDTKQTYVELMLQHMSSKPDANYLGVISYSEIHLRNPQPMFIWKKL